MTFVVKSLIISILTLFGNQLLYLTISSSENYTNNSNKIRHVYSRKTTSPNWPPDFTRVSVRQYNVKNKRLLTLLREIEGGKWKKVYEDGYLTDGTEVSIHYFRSKSGKIFNLKVKRGWSNL